MFLGLILGAKAVKAEELTTWEISINQKSHHLNPKDWYNESHDLFAVRVGNYTFGNFTNSFYQPTRFVGYVSEFPVNGYFGWQMKVLWVNGYTQMRNMIIPSPSVYVGKNLRFNVSALPGAISYGFSIKFSWE